MEKKLKGEICAPLVKNGVKSILGFIIRSRREELGWSREQLVEEISTRTRDEVSVDKSTLYRLETGQQHSAQVSTLRLISVGLRLDRDFLGSLTVPLHEMTDSVLSSRVWPMNRLSPSYQDDQVNGRHRIPASISALALDMMTADSPSSASIIAQQISSLVEMFTTCTSPKQENEQPTEPLSSDSLDAVDDMSLLVAMNALLERAREIEDPQLKVIVRAMYRQIEREYKSRAETHLGS